MLLKDLIKGVENVSLQELKAIKWWRMLSEEDSKTLYKRYHPTKEVDQIKVLEIVKIFNEFTEK